MTAQEFYKDSFEQLTSAQKQLLSVISQYSDIQTRIGNLKGVEYCHSRIKTPESMSEKLKRLGFPATEKAALTQVHDALGIRIVCSFVDDIYQIAHWLTSRSEFEVIAVKDYIAHPKISGYRSYHMIVRLLEGQGKGVTAEIQIRTIALDFWASLEHQLKYKQEIPNEALIRSELKRCADEISSVDLTMQTIKDLIREGIPPGS